MIRFRGAALAAVVFLGLSGCDGKNADEVVTQAPAGISLPADSIVIAEVRTVSPSFEYPGVVEAMQRARVRAEVSAVLREVHFTPGQVVDEGELLMVFDDSQYRAAHEAALAELQTAEAQAEQAEATWSRAEKLLPQGVISQQDYDAAKAGIGSAKAAIARAEAGLEKAELDLGHTKLHAPFTGKISKANYSVGDYIIASSPTQPEPLFELVQLDPVYVMASVELTRYHQFVLLRTELEEKGVTIPKLTLRLELAGGQLYPSEGTFEAWDNSSAASTGTIAGRVLFSNPDELLLPGNNVTILGETLESFDRVLIPQKAVQQDQQGYFVKILDENNTVQRRNVELGARYQKDWAVLDGLEAGTRVIAAGGQMLRAGTPVQVAQG